MEHEAHKGEFRSLEKISKRPELKSPIRRIRRGREIILKGALNIF